MKRPILRPFNACCIISENKRVFLSVRYDGSLGFTKNLQTTWMHAQANRIFERAITEGFDMTEFHIHEVAPLKKQKWSSPTIKKNE